MSMNKLNIDRTASGPTANSAITPKVAFVTVTDYNFFPGTVATVNSLFCFHPEAEVIAINNLHCPLSGPQRTLLEEGGVRLLDSDVFEQEGRYIGPWELKAYAACDLAPAYDLIIGIDSDCVLCSPVDDMMRLALESGQFLGGSDGDGTTYDASYQPYGITPGSHNPQYMSTSLYFCPVTAKTREVLKRWAQCVSQAVFNGKGAYPGHGDQGVLNAVLYSQPQGPGVTLLENPLWSQHWNYWDSIVSYDAHQFVNRSQERQRQRSFHCGGAEKFWEKGHSERIFRSNQSQGTNYAWWLYQFWFGRCQNRQIDPAQTIPERNLHLLQDLVNYFAPMQKFDPHISLWTPRSTGLLNRLVGDIRGCMNFNGSMEDYLEIVRQLPEGAKIVEVGSCEGRSIVSLALGCLDRDYTFYSVESFTGDLNGAFDGHSLPSIEHYLQNVKQRFPFLKINCVFERSEDASRLFTDASLDAVFIDACHSEECVHQDICCWLPKVKTGGVLFGDDWSWDSVKKGVAHVFSPDQVQPSLNGHLWQVWLK